ncbi:MAG TPA: acetyl-CoA carboxylase biotin carboxylase subunit, partial [Candidatus Krumholzibacteria bacterium]|nr:acetyl-CoA carboxylase biotin carboxylase subunit [Candidatus Krumholzibacteria bacterium]
SLFKTLLVANRGEIALRVVRACREMGIRSVAVYSDADRLAPHVLEADEAHRIGPPPSSESYLRIDSLLGAARKSGAEAVHPGYGFLSEREVFARAVEDAGLVFVGPAPATLAAMGDKTEARRRMHAAGVPIVPGVVDALADPGAAARAAEEIGFPVLLKAAAGGGGKGMRVVRSGSELGRAFEAASREALAAFGDGSVYLERFLDRPRHVEIQVLGDRHGRVLHLGERECSIQRRHQKLVEEAPSPVLTPEQREEMGGSAVRAAAAVDYVGAGTVEFLYDEARGAFYFLEMNTRIQVEHPITECTTGIDLVQWQLRIARGEALAFEQKDIGQRGHAIECRIYAEDERKHFIPSCGVISLLREPAGPGVRVDSGVYQGWEVTSHYDPILAKLVAFGETREVARRRMLRALDEYVVQGVATSVDLHKRILRHPSFVAAKVDTAFLDEHATDLLEPAKADVPDLAFIAAALAAESGSGRGARATHAATNDDDAPSPWETTGSWEIGRAS